jgi:two-component system response regulator HydG
MALIVVIDDDAAHRELVRSALESRGHEIVEFPDAIPALNSSDLPRADVIITDLLMPSPGEKLIRHVSEWTDPVPVVVMSAYVTPEEWDSVGELGAACFVQKPLDLAELTATVERYAAAGGREA